MFNHLGTTLEEVFEYISCHKFAVPLKNTKSESVLSFHSERMLDSQSEVKHIFIGPPKMQLPALYVPKQAKIIPFTANKVSLPDKNITHFQKLNQYVAEKAELRSSNDNVLSWHDDYFYSGHRFGYFSMPIGEFALKTSNQAINIRNPQNFQIIAHKFHEVIKDTSNAHVTLKRLHAFEHLLPDFTHRSQNSQSLWIDLIRTITRNSSGIATTKYIRKERDRLHAQLSLGKTSFTVKDCSASEEILAVWLGLDFLRSLQLKHLQIPEFIAMGKYRTAKLNERFFIILTYLHGRTPNSMMKEMQEMIKLSNQAGKALGELQNKGLKTVQTAGLSTPIVYWESQLEEVITNINDMLPALQIRRIKADSPHLPKLIQDLKNDPGALSYYLNDIHAEQFAYLDGKLGFFDLELVVSTVDWQRNPLQLVSAEYSSFRSMFETSGLMHGLTLEETGAYKQSFSRGYFSEYPHTHSRAASQFFELLNELDTIQTLAFNAIKGEYKNIKMIKHLVSKTNRKLKTGEF